VWTHEFEDANWGGVLTTAGDLVFAGGTSDRYVRAFDARTGEVLWQLRTNSGVIGVPSTYSVDGVQYVAIQSGWGVDAASMAGRLAQERGTREFVPQGGVVWVFALSR
jgi:alcohol dehydrogenase (cytochrome c)